MDRFLDLPLPVRAVVFGVVAVALGFFGVQAMDGTDAPAEETTTSQPDDTSTVVTQPSAGDQPSAGGTKGAAAPRGEKTPTEALVADLAMPVSKAQIARAGTQAVGFVEEFASYAYDQDAGRWRTRLTRMLARNSQVDLTGLVPTGAARQQMVADQVVTTVTVTEVGVALVSPGLVAFDVTARTDTVTKKKTAPATREVAYQVTLTRGATWKVANLVFLDGRSRGSD